MALDAQTRNKLARLVAQARQILVQEFTRQLQELYGIQPDGTVIEVGQLTHLSDQERSIAQMLRDRLIHLASGERQPATDKRLKAEEQKRAQAAAVDRLIWEQAFTVLNRLAALRLCEERRLLEECVRQGMQSRGFKVYEKIAGTGLGETFNRYKTFLFCLFDEIAVDLGILFDRFSPVGLLFPREKALLALLELLNNPDLKEIWTADETIGWIYQYFNSPEERKKMREESAAPRNSRELAVRNQFFTPRYVVEFLTDNTLGRLWYDLRQGDTALREQCRYLVRLPDEVFVDETKEPEVARAIQWLKGEDERQPGLWQLAHTVNGYLRAGQGGAVADAWLTERLPRLISSEKVAELRTQELLDLLFIFCRRERFFEGTLEEHANEIKLIQEEISRRVKRTRNKELPQEELLNTPVIIPFRAKKDPRDLKILDPACGSGHFLLYAFDLLETIYQEAWEEQYAVGSRQYAEKEEKQRGRGEPSGRQKLSGLDSLAEGHGSGRVDLPADQGVPQRGDIRSDQPGPSGGSVDPLQYRRESGQDLQQGVSQLSLYGAWVSAGSGNPYFDSSAPAIPLRGENQYDSPSSGGSGKITPRTHEVTRRGQDLNQPSAASCLLPPAYSDRSLVEEYPDKQEFLKQIPKLIIEHNLHGIDIDPRAVQIAALALWLRAQRSWQGQGLKPADRPRITRSNLVTAEPMPGDAELRQEFLAGLQPRLLGQLVEVVFDKMRLAGEAGSLLKIEEEITAAVAEASEQWHRLQGLAAKKGQPLALPGFLTPKPEQGQLFQVGEITEEAFWKEAEGLILKALRNYAEQVDNGRSRRRRLFADDAAQGFAFLDLCRQKYDVVLMNPPFGEATGNSKSFLAKTYPHSKMDLFAAFVERGLSLLRPGGRLGAITSRTGFFLSSFTKWREEILLKEARPLVFADLGFGVMDAAMVEAAAYCLEKNPESSFKNRN